MRDVWELGTTLASQELALRVRKFRVREERLIRRTALQHCFESSRVSIRVKSVSLELVTVFMYLVRTVACNNIDWAALYRHLWRAWRRWEMVGKVVLKTGAMVRVQGMLYKEVV